MEAPSRSSQKHLLLQVWCGLLTLALVAMAAFVASIKCKPEETSGASVKLENMSSPAASARFSPERLAGPSPAYIQLETAWQGDGWKEQVSCESRSLALLNGSIYCNSNSSARSFLFIYAQVVFKQNSGRGSSVALIRNASEGRRERKETEIPAAEGERSVWVGKIVAMTGGDSVRLDITGEYDRGQTFWGAFQLR